MKLINIDKVVSIKCLDKRIIIDTKFDNFFVEEKVIKKRSKWYKFWEPRKEILIPSHYKINDIDFDLDGIIKYYLAKYFTCQENEIIIGDDFVYLKPRVFIKMVNEEHLIYFDTFDEAKQWCVSMSESYQDLLIEI